MRPIREGLLIGTLALATAATSVSTDAANWPERNVRIVVASAPGSSIDAAARLFAEQLSPRWGQPVVIDNRPGADGIIAVQALLQANDGHTLLLAFPGVVTVVPLLHEKRPYDPIGDLILISSIANDFLTIDRSLLMCRSHGACFDISTGLCVAGPCVGANLQSIAIRVEHDCVMLADDPDALAARFA